jgi:hypothetical protein
MITKKTVFVVGAGASFEALMPTGIGLAQAIRTSLKNAYDDTPQARYMAYRPSDNTAARMYEHHCDYGDKKNFERAAQKLWGGLPTTDSIDEFLFNHRYDTELLILGKCLIASEIAKAEASSLVYQEPGATFSFDRLQDTWYKPLISALTNGLSPDEAAKTFANTTFICFNYDRCLEMALLIGLTLRFAISVEDAARIVRSCKIIHPWGFLGDVPQISRSATSIRFGGGIDNFQIWKNLSTYSENIPEMKDRQDAIHVAMLDCQNLIFLGFSYNKQNMNFIRPPKMPLAENFLGTTKGLPSTVKQQVLMDLTTFHGGQQGQQGFRYALSNDEASCTALMREYFITIAE